MEDRKVSKTFYLGEVAGIPSTPADCVLLSGAHRLTDSTGGKGGGLLLVVRKGDKCVPRLWTVEVIWKHTR